MSKIVVCKKEAEVKPYVTNFKIKKFLFSTKAVYILY